MKKANAKVADKNVFVVIKKASVIFNYLPVANESTGQIQNRAHLKQVRPVEA
ncbi:hypothetical protein O59_003469 [Cellvibrio sp. BR]|nr:hypothetical protein O59_003469 [Cellvibrio sp. BR]